MSRPVRLLVCLLFFASGGAALIYEVVWFQILELVIGSSATSAGILLGVFMGGMCLGSILFPRIASPGWHPLRAFALLEVAVACWAVALLFAVPAIDDFYAWSGGRTAIRIAISVACLSVPTIAMGATLPALAGLAEGSGQGARWLGWLYTSNLAGAVSGTFLASFYLLRHFDVGVATAVAATCNVAAAIAAWRLADRTAIPSTTPSVAGEPTPRIPRPVLVVAALSGCTALGAQVVWTRLMSLVLGATVYNFALILAAFLIGLGVGSGTSTLAARHLSPRSALAWCQLLLCVALAWAAYFLAQMPFWASSAVLPNDLARSLLVVLPGALLWGASFPLALLAATGGRQGQARVSGTVYAANTVGAIVGALATSSLLIPLAGTYRTQQLLVLVAGSSGILALLWSRSTEPLRPHVPVLRGVAFAEIAGVIVSVALVVMSILPIPPALIAHGRSSRAWAEAASLADPGEIIYTGEGQRDFVAVSKGANGHLYYHASGKVQASTVPEDMRLQLLLGHLSHLIPQRVSNVLIIGCGAGITAGALSLAPDVERITIADIEPLVPSVASTFFAAFNERVLDDARVTVRIDDGRHVLATSNETYDVITTDLIDPWVKGVATLFTEEFFELAKRRLRPGGVVSQFVQLYQSNVDAVQTEIATFQRVFPHSVVFGNPNSGHGYDLVLLGQAEPIRIDIDAFRQRLSDSRYEGVRRSLASIGLSNPTDLLATYAASADDLKGWLEGAAINQDRNLRLQYLAAGGLADNESTAIYRALLQQARPPTTTFVGTASSVSELLAGIAAKQAESLR